MVGARRAVAAAAAATAAVTTSVRGKATLPALPYDFGALEPVVSGHIMELHHGKHHAAYVTNYNVAEEKLHDALAKNDIAASIALQGALKFNGGGHVNHSIFWTNLAPIKQGGGELPAGNALFARAHVTAPAFALPSLPNRPAPLGCAGALADAIKTQFGSLDAFKAKFAAAAVGVQGSGWGWLVRSASARRPVASPTRR